MSVARDQYFQNVSLLLHCDGPNGSTAFTDNSKLARTVVSTATISGSNPKFGSGSARFSGGTGINAGIGYNFSGQFTIEFYLRFDNLNRAGEVLLTLSGGTATPDRFYISKNDLGGIGVAIGSNSGTFAAGLVAGQMNHIAVTRNSLGVVDIFANGTKGGIGNGQFASSYIPLNNRALLIGRDTAIGNDLIGNIDEIRITEGHARYVANFIPSTNPFPDLGP